jgi:CheY-like chemotaxis protein
LSITDPFFIFLSAVRSRKNLPAKGTELMSSILVIDDEKTVLNVIETALTTFGYRVEVAGDGREGIEKFDQGRYDLVITDLIMPNLDGGGVVEHIRSSDRKKTPIIGISGTPWLLNEIDVDRVLTKPFPIQALVDSIKNLSVASLN